jgi:hypothetical protein
MIGSIIACVILIAALATVIHFCFSRAPLISTVVTVAVVAAACVHEHERDET